MFTNNSTRGLGGGAVNNSGTMSISGSTFTGNSATAAFGVGGAVSSFTNSPNQLTIAGSLITGNSAAADGGGVSTAFSGTANITNSTVSNNTANSDNNTSGSGGGLYFRSDAGTVTVSGSTINGNQALGNATAAGNGGGINVQGNLNLTNSTVSGNTAGRDGGGIYDDFTGGTNSNVAITSSTIVNNTATVNGGGLRGSTSVGDAPTSVRNTIIANNTANGGTSQDVSGAVASQGFNLFETTTGATITGDTATNITGQDPNLGALQNNGGLTFTHALLAGSPAIDKGNSFGLTIDQRGTMRPYDNSSIPNQADGADIGAFEFIAPTAATATIGGRVTAGGRRGVSGAVVRLTDQNGVIRMAPTDFRGYFQFEDVAVGETYILSVFSKQYQYTPQIISVNENITDLNFTAQ